MQLVAIAGHLFTQYSIKNKEQQRREVNKRQAGKSAGSRPGTCGSSSKEGRGGENGGCRAWDGFVASASSSSGRNDTSSTSSISRSKGGAKEGSSSSASTSTPAATPDTSSAQLLLKPDHEQLVTQVGAAAVVRAFMSAVCRIS